jgi:hypothetical protein
MAQRGRKSAAATETEALVAVDVRRPKPASAPAELTEGQAQVWRAAVSAMPGTWLTHGAHPLLISYCRHVCRARVLESMIKKFELEWTTVEGGLERFDRLLAMAERETRAALACARALRLTPQAQIQPRTAGRRVSDQPSDDSRPWDFD